MVTLEDIAKELGISVSVVSRVLNKTPDAHARVSSLTRDRVKEAAKRLGFRRNRSAEFMRRGRIATIGVFLPEFANCLISDLIFGLSEAANIANFPLCISVGLQERSYLDFLRNHHEQSSIGIISYSLQQFNRSKPEILENYRENGGKILILNDISEISLPTLSMDEVFGGQLAAQVLLTHPCDEFYCISNQETPALVSSNLLAMRTFGFQNCLQSAGFTAKIIFFNDEDKLMSQMLKKRRKVGIFATSDRTALGFLTKARHLGLRCGTDFWLVGYDDLEAAQLSDPPLTTIHQPFRQQGRRAIEKIIRLIYGTLESSEILQPSVVQRGTA